jgi:hypothetical protein
MEYLAFLLLALARQDGPAPTQPLPLVRALAEQMELVGPHEDWGHDHAGLYLWVRAALHDLAGAPHLVEAERLPPIGVIDGQIEANRLCRERLQRQIDYDLVRGPCAWQALREAERLQEWWSRARCARSESYTWYARRFSLQWLRAQIGEQAYWASDWPPAVPVWSYERR